ncbi:MAG: zinc ribbon domain-containing protein [Promethearchaeota archaeon]|nr:MAG: zinc ribbon domain-containing protein [Candidatus Lokiarchaeota archaeon]
MEENIEQSVASKSFNNLLGDGFKLFFKNYSKLILPLVLFVIFSVIVRVFILTDLRWFSAILSKKASYASEKFLKDPFSVSEDEYNLIILDLWLSLLVDFLDALILNIFTIIAMCSVSNFLYKKYIQQDPEFFDEFKKSFNLKMLKPILILGVCGSIGLILLLIPGILIYGYFIFLVYTYNLSNNKDQISKTRKITKGSFWNNIFIFLIPFIIISLSNAIYMFTIDFFWNLDNDVFMSWHNPETRNYGMLILYFMIYSIIDMIFAPLFICLLTPFFARAKARYELGDQYYSPKKQQDYKPHPVQQTYPVQQPYPAQENTWQSRIQEGSGIYCPYCGHKIDNPIKHCPSCGENISNLKK